MAQYHAHLRIHLIFSTKDRRRSIAPAFESKLHSYLGGIARQNDTRMMAVNGVADHVHMLLGLSPQTVISTLVRLLKCNSSRWARRSHDRRFAWQSGYAAFSVSRSMEQKTLAYIRKQKEHH
ncbi:MAG: IS200/IS605 family transposase, partial [Phycisphaerae bacterium]